MYFVENRTPFGYIDLHALKEYMKKIGSTLYRWWMKFAHVLALVNTTLLLSLVYILLIGPFSLISRLLGKDLLNHRLRSVASYWEPKNKVGHTLEDTTRQF